MGEMGLPQSRGARDQDGVVQPARRDGSRRCRRVGRLVAPSDDELRKGVARVQGPGHNGPMRKSRDEFKRALPAPVIPSPVLPSPALNLSTPVLWRNAGEYAPCLP